MNELASEEESASADAEVPADELGPVAVETQIVVSKSSGGALTIDAVAEGEFCFRDSLLSPLTSRLSE
jgi:hypothetical protein